MIEQNLIIDPVLASFYETEPVGFKDQDWFLNSAAFGRSNIKPEDLIISLKEIEKKIGRSKNLRWREREIDIDIIIYGDIIIDSENLTIPHPRMHERNFVLVPSNEIAANLIDPRNKKSINLLLRECEDIAEVKILKG